VHQVGDKNVEPRSFDEEKKKNGFCSAVTGVSGMEVEVI
jgi:hypothetical protein